MQIRTTIQMPKNLYKMAVKVADTPQYNGNVSAVFRKALIFFLSHYASKCTSDCDCEDFSGHAAKTGRAGSCKRNSRVSRGQ